MFTMASSPRSPNSSSPEKLFREVQGSHGLGLRAAERGRGGAAGGAGSPGALRRGGGGGRRGESTVVL